MALAVDVDIEMNGMMYNTNYDTGLAVSQFGLV